MTTGGPDAADVYEEEINPDNQRQYKFDGSWRTMTVRTETIRVKEAEAVKEVPFEIEHTHHGPVVARRPGKAYAMKLPYFDQFQLSEQSYAMATAKSLADMKKALSMFQLMEQNIMVATVDGDIFYVRNGRVPIRPKGFDWKRPVAGNTSASEWQGIHGIGDLVQNTNPWQGYLQNCNVSPEFMTRFCPMVPERFADRPYLYNPDNPLHQRAAMVRDLLHGNTRVTVADAIHIALSPEVYNADLWQARLVAACEKRAPNVKMEKKSAALLESIIHWNRRADADSTGAIAYLFWKNQLWKTPNGQRLLQGERAGMPPPATVTDDQLLEALAKGADELYQQWGKLEVKYGEVFRVGREGSNKTWPVAGGSVVGLATPRAISFNPMKDGKTFLGRGGQTSVQLVQLTNPPRSWTLLPLGQSDHRTSKHWDDQAEQLFSPGKMKPTYFLDKAELLKHAESTKVLQRPLE
jgi:acyl-homoserine-lactone acylase